MNLKASIAVGALIWAAASPWAVAAAGTGSLGLAAALPLGYDTPITHPSGVDVSSFATAASPGAMFAGIEASAPWLLQAGDSSTHLASLSGASWASISRMFADLHATAEMAADYGARSSAYSLTMIVQPVPEAETWAMLLTGLGLVALRLRRQMKPHAQLIG